MSKTLANRGAPAAIGVFKTPGPVNSPLTAIILAAGASLRMGISKASLPFGDSETFLGRLLSVYAAIDCDVIVVLPAGGARQSLFTSSRRSPEISSTASLRIAVNSESGGDRLSSIRCGLAMAPRSSAVFLQDVDRPFVTASVLRALVSGASERGYVAPDIGGRGGHPLLLSPSVAAAVRTDRQSSTLREALAPFERTLVAVDEKRCELNINTPDDYRIHVSSEARHAS